VVGNIVQQRKLIFKTADGKSMNHLIHDYVKFKVKTKSPTAASPTSSWQPGIWEAQIFLQFGEPARDKKRLLHKICSVWSSGEQKKRKAMLWTSIGFRDFVRLLYLHCVSYFSLDLSVCDVHTRTHLVSWLERLLFYFFSVISVRLAVGVTFGQCHIQRKQKPKRKKSKYLTSFSLCLSWRRNFVTFIFFCPLLLLFVSSECHPRELFLFARVWL